MKTKLLKKVSIFFIGILVFCSMGGCWQEKKPELKLGEEQVQEEQFQAEQVAWEEDMQPDFIDAMFYKDAQLFFIAEKEEKKWLYTMALDGTEQEKLKITYIPGDVKVFCTDAHGNYRMIIQKNKVLKSGNISVQYIYAEFVLVDGILEQVDMQKIEDSETITNVALDMERVVIVRSFQNAEIYKKDEKRGFTNVSGNRKYIVQCGDSNCVSMCSNGKLWNFTGRKIEQWKMNENKRVVTININENGGAAFLIPVEDGEYGVCFINEEGIYGCREDGKYELLLEWLSNDIDGSRIRSVAGDGKIFFASGMQGELYRIAEDISKDMEKEVVTIATTLEADSLGYLMDKIQEFNNSQEEYLVRLSAYGKYENPEEQLLLDVMAGKGPDVIMLDSETGNILDRLDKKDSLVDLYPYMDADKDISRGDFVENALHLLETNGKLTRIAENFSIHTMIGTKEFIGDRQSWTWEEFVGCCKKIPEGGYPFIGGYTSVDNIFLQAFPNIYSQYFNLQTGEVYMEDGRFYKDKKLSEMVYGERKWEISSTDFYDISEKVKQGDIYVCSYSMAAMPFVLQPDYGKIEVKTELALIGYPSDTGSGISMSFGEMYAITVFSEHKEGAWQFLKSILAADNNKYTCAPGSLPIRKADYERNKKCMMAKKDYVDEDGTKIFALGASNHCRVSQEQVDMVERMVEMADCRTLPSEHPVWKIVNEELLEYANEETRTLEQMEEHIEHRLRIYFSEQEY